MVTRTFIPMQPFGLITGLGLLAGATVLYSLSTGSLDTDWAQLGRILSGSAEGLAASVVWDIRLPRTITAFTTGALLALAGALMQVLLRNPLADPYILGISGGAAAGALATLLLGLGGMWLHGAAFAGALLSMLLVFGLSHSRGTWTPTRLLLTGVVVAAGWGAVIGFLLAISTDSTLRGMVFWLMGDLSYRQNPLPGVVVLIPGLLLAMLWGRQLNILARGELPAAALGVEVVPLRRAIYVLGSLLSAAAVSLAGSVGFVGLIIPHLLRLLGARDHRILLPASVLLGGSLLVLADTLARTVLAPRQLPVGILTALIGVPVFLFLLHRNTAQTGETPA